MNKHLKIIESLVLELIDMKKYSELDNKDLEAIEHYLKASYPEVVITENFVLGYIVGVKSTLEIERD